MVEFAASRDAELDLNCFFDSRRTWGRPPPGPPPGSRLTRSPSDRPRPGTCPGSTRASSSIASAALTSAAATSTIFRARSIFCPSSFHGGLLGREVLDELGDEKPGEDVALLHLVADVDDPLVDVGRQLGIDRGPLVRLDEARLADDPDDLAELRGGSPGPSGAWRRSCSAIPPRGRSPPPKSRPPTYRPGPNPGDGPDPSGSSSRGYVGREGRHRGSLLEGGRSRFEAPIDRKGPEIVPGGDGRGGQAIAGRRRGLAVVDMAVGVAILRRGVAAILSSPAISAWISGSKWLLSRSSG